MYDIIADNCDFTGGPRGRGFNRESRAITLDKGLFFVYCKFFY